MGTFYCCRYAHMCCNMACYNPMQVALGMAKVATGEVQYDQRLFNQEQGMASGFGAEDSYAVYDKPLFVDRSAAGMVHGWFAVCERGERLGLWVVLPTVCVLSGEVPACRPLFTLDLVSGCLCRRTVPAQECGGR